MAKKRINIHSAAVKLQRYFEENNFNGMPISWSVNTPAYEDDDAIEEMGSKKAAREWASNYACIEISWDEPDIDGDIPYLRQEFDLDQFEYDFLEFLHKRFGDDVTISPLKNYGDFEVQRNNTTVPRASK